MRMTKAVFILLIFIMSCGSGGGEDSPGTPPVEGEYFFDAQISNGQVFDYFPITVNTSIGFEDIRIQTLDQRTGESFNLNFIRPDEVPIEMPIGSGEPLDTHGADFFIRGDSFIYKEGTITITFLSNNEISADFDFIAESQLNPGLEVRATGSFHVPNGLIALEEF